MSLPMFAQVPASFDKIEFYTDSSPRLRGMMVPTMLDEAGIRVLASWGANHIRWQLTWDGFPHSQADYSDYDAYKVWLEKALAHMDQMLPVCRSLGIKVTLDLHTPPGGRLNDYNHKIFAEKPWQDSFISVWKYLARRYKDSTTIWGYDIVNEPVDGRVAPGAMNWQTLAGVVAREVRVIDPAHPIIIEARGGDIATLLKFEPIDVPGIVYSFHMYRPHSFTHQHIGGNKTFHYPGRVGLKWWNKNALEKLIADVRDWQLRYNAQIYVGEFSAIRWAPGDEAFTYLRDCIDIFEQYNWSWCYHAFREYDGWSVEHDNVKADTKPVDAPTTRQRLFMEAFKKNVR